MLRTLRELADELMYWMPRFSRLARQASTRRDRLRQTVVFLIWLLGDAAGMRSRRAVEMRGSYGNLLVRDYSQMLVILEVLVDESYDHPDLPPDADLILDIGCNIGAAALWFAMRYPAARIVGVEPDPATCRLARRNVAGQRRITIVNAAVSDEPGEATLWISPQSWSSSTVTGAGEPIRVPAVHLDDLIAREGPRKILKIDAEGAEHAILRSSVRLREIEFITGEYHPVGGSSWRQMINRLDGFVVEPGVDVPDQRRTFTARRAPRHGDPGGSCGDTRSQPQPVARGSDAP